ncbi:acetamidase [Purpureocillium lavendulum]|uniref:Acetamidase n=1 Tax=Purpureocillium lavendulum TaxID=1247861 RepID=A0AB34FT87_9HYPO|nr:acetamidase [Purpureocillium lavendulum]
MTFRAERGVSQDAVSPPLPQAAGYAVVIGVGFLIALVMMALTRLLKRTVGEDNKTTEMFMTANRSVGTGLTASAVVSSWLWSTAMLGSTLVGYNFGVAGPFWFAAGCSPMIVFFAVLGIACKMRVPEAHTLLEIVRIRYGKLGHVVWIVLCLINNIIAIANMLLGASSAIAALTGMHVIAATFLLPVGVVLYTFVGGIKATFLTDYMHTVCITIIICFFTVKTFVVPEIGSPAGLYDIIEKLGQLHPVAGNEDGSYLTMTSKNAILFGIIHILANFGLVIMDTGFFSKAFSAAPHAVVPGYIVGGIAYFAIPWCLGTLMSFSALALEGTDRFPTFPRRMSPVEVSNGLVLPYAAVAIAGQGGAVAVLLIVFMAVTSTISAQVIAVSSIISFDIYRQYFNRQASDRDAIRWSHIGVVAFGIFSAAFSTALYYGKVDLGWTLYMLGVLTCPGIFPTIFTILWKKQSKAAAIISPLLGMAIGIAVWLGSASALYGEVSVASTGQTLPCVYGTVASALSPGLLSIVISVARPAHFDWAEFRNERLAFNKNPGADSDEELKTHEENVQRYADDKIRLKRWGRIAAIWAAATFFGHWVVWPLPMYAAKYVFERGFFVAWVSVAIVWVWGTMLVVSLYPIADGWSQIRQVYRALGRVGRKSNMSSLAAESWTWYGLTWLVVVIRMVSQILLRGSVKKLKPDDGLMLFAMATDTVLIVCMNIISHTNSNLIDPNEPATLTPEDIKQRVFGSKMVLVSEQMQILTIWTVKACLLLMYHRLTLSLKGNLIVKIVAGYVAVGFVVMEVLYLGVWCRPFSQYWAVPPDNPQCSAATNHLITNAVLNISSDLMIIMIPMPIFLQSRISLKKKIVLCTVFALGGFTILSAILNKYYSFSEPYGSAWTFWYIRESSTAIIVANLPLTWTLFRRMFNLRSFNGGSDYSKTRSGHPTSTVRSQGQRRNPGRSYISAGEGRDGMHDLGPAESQEQINKDDDYGISLKIYQRRDVQVKSEPAAGTSGSKSESNESLPEGLTTTIKGGHRDSTRDVETSVHVRIPLLYVNREARDVALAWIQREAKATEVRYREDGTDRVFGRTFEAQRDALYVETETLNDFYSEPYDRLFEPDLAQRMVSSGPGITRLAVSESTFRSENSALTDMFDWYSGVAEIFVVVGTQPRWEHNSRKVQRRWTLKDAPGCPLVWNLAQQSFEAPSPESSSPESNTWMADVCRGWTERLVWHQVETLGVRKAYAVAH